MKAGKPHTISTVILWICMLITCGLFVWFYAGYIRDPEEMDMRSTDWMVNWMLLIALLSTGALLLFTLLHFIRMRREGRKKRFRQLLWLIFLGVLAGASWLLGSGKPLDLPGYQGSENTFFWLKLTDMWLYSAYILLVATFVALLAGIIVSYLKRGK